MLRQFSTRRIVGSFILDWLGTIVALILATYLRAFLEVGVGIWPGLPGTGSFRNIIENWPTQWLMPQVLILVSVIWPFFLLVYGVYDGRRTPTRRAELVSVFFAVCTATLVLTGILFLTFRETSRWLFLTFFILDLAVLFGGRGVLYLYRAIWNGKRNTELKSVLIVGAGEVGERVAEELSKYGERDIQVAGFLDDNPGKIGAQISGYPVLGTLDQIQEFAQELCIQDAVVALPLRAHQRLIEAARRLQEAGIHVHVVPDLFALSFPSASLDGFSGIPVLDLGRPGIHGEQRTLKRVFDVLAVSLGLILISPLMLLIAIFIKLDSHGPVLYKQKRIGENGMLFLMYKFRSMSTDADENLHKAHVTRLIRGNLTPEEYNGGKGGSLKMEADSRVTRLGYFIRKTSLDELPQLFNVLRGEMSLVGPRPPLPYEFEVYQDWHKRRLEAPPGITGLWQVRARNQVSFDEMVRMDLEYIDRYSFWLDIKLILQTPWALISARGAG